ncbi:hypothetical protein RF11_10520 [Thelohanellus kitauei]|uniref:Uncharacterized protein n=1 Tax=Thelohanellus kitauei TaxID=669202 RepID=A0A0C2MG50_THEKT|nr:hypothetical protein RF11_10520 [Thelohanellus kitauei]
MSQPTQVLQALNMTDQPRSVEYVKLVVSTLGQNDFHLTMKGYDESRYFIIEEISNSEEKNRIMVPMDYCKKFLARIHKVLKFANRKSSKWHVQPTPKDLAYIFCVRLSTESGRKYYFDVIIKDGIRKLKLSYVYQRRREIFIDFTPLASFVKVIEKFQKEYPSLTGKDDVHLTKNNQSNNLNGTQMTGPSANNEFVFDVISVLSSTTHVQSINSVSPTGSSEDPKSTSTLNVSTDPVPNCFTHGTKTYQFEVLPEDNTFLRITEKIGGIKKSTLNIPIERMNTFVNILTQMDDRFWTVAKDIATSMDPRE